MMTKSTTVASVTSTDTCTSTTTTPASVGTTEVSMSVKYRREFKIIQGQYAQLFDECTEILENDETVTQDKLKRFLSKYPDLKTSLKDAKTISDVVDLIQDHSSITCCSYLRSVATRFNISAVIEKIDNYYKYVDDFCQNKLTHHIYMKPFITSESITLTSATTIAFKLQWSTITKTLSDIQSILRLAFHDYSTDVHIVVLKGSIRVLCYSPQHIMKHLVRLAHVNKEVLVGSGVTYFRVGDTIVVDNSGQNKISLVEDLVLQLPIALQLKDYSQYIFQLLAKGKNEAKRILGTGSSKPPIYKMPSERKQKTEACLSNIAAIDFGTTYCSLAYKTKEDPGVTVVRLDSSVQRVPNAILLRVTGKHQVCSMCHCEPEICKSNGVCASDYAKYKELRRNMDSANSKALDMPPLIPRRVCCEVVSFGRQAQDEYIRLRESNYDNHIFFERIKVALITNQFHRDMTIEAVDGRKFYAVEVIALVLKYLKEKLLNELTCAVHAPIKASNFQWVITVPAIWKSRGKQMMREAAYLAGLCTDDNSANPAITSLTDTGWPIGIPEEKHPDKVLLALEPEAAAIELSSSFKESLHFMVIDMGGGTVDITAHEVHVAKCSTSSAAGPRVTSQSILEPVGNEFGGSQVNRMFEIFLHKLLPAEKFDAFLNKGEKHRAMWNALVWLEFEKAKVAFGDSEEGSRDIDSYSSDGKEPDVLSLHVDKTMSDLFEEAHFDNHQGIKFIKDDCVLHMNYLTVVQEFFKPVAEGAMQCVRQALKQLDSKVDTIYLVGGFGGCKYIHGYIKAALKTDEYANTAIVQAEESFLTVARGAVRYGENPQVITSRKADATYGIVTSVPFVRGDHDPAYSFRDSRGALYCNNVFYMCVEKGGSIPSDVVFTTTLTPPDLQQKQMKLEIVMTDEARPGYTTDKKGKKTVVDLGCLIIKLPESSATENQTVNITLDFSGTELKVRAHFNHGTSEDIVTIIDFL